MNELWKKINVAPKYMVSNLGRVKRIKILKPSKSREGYLSVYIRVDMKLKNLSIHRLVAAAFLGHSKLPVNHIDHDKHNNCISNLAYVTPKQNSQHSSICGRLARGICNGNSKLMSNDVLQIRKLINNGVKSRQIAKQFNVSASEVTEIKKKRVWEWLTLILLLLSTPAHANQDRIAIETIILESRGEILDGQIAVGEVIRNRAKQRHQTFEQVVMAKRQFSCWDSRSNAKIRLSQVSGKTWQKASKAWQLSEHTNLVNGATHYHAISVHPYWAKDHTPIRLGSHLFYKDIQ